MAIDKATKEKMDLLYPDFAVRVLRVYSDMLAHYKIQMRMTAGLRTFDEQAVIYAQGRTAPGPIVTNAPPGFSLHHYGVACDSCRVGKEPWNVPWEEFAALAKGHGLYSGFYWPKAKRDRPHLELAYGGMSVEQMLNLYQNKGLYGVWAEFDSIRGVPQGSEWYGPQKTGEL